MLYGSMIDFLSNEFLSSISIGWGVFIKDMLVHFYGQSLYEHFLTKYISKVKISI